MDLDITKPILKKNGLFVFWCLTLYALPARRSLLTFVALAQAGDLHFTGIEEQLKGEGDQNTNSHLKAFGVGIRLFSEEIGP